MAKRHFKKHYKKVRMKMINQDLRLEQPVDGVASFIMESLEDKVSPELLDFIYEMLLGFHVDMQLEIADDLLDFITMNMIHTTGCKAVDLILLTCYHRIAEEMGIKIVLK